MSEIGPFSVDNMADDFPGQAQGLADQMRHHASAAAALAEQMQSELPTNAPVHEVYSGIASGLNALADLAEQGRGVFEQAHSTDLERTRNPRPGEEKWRPAGQ
jgi:hypothetical protein